MRYQWLWGDLRRAVSEGRGGQAADVLGCLAYARGATHGIWSPEDPWLGLPSWQHNLWGTFDLVIARGPVLA